MEQLFEHLNISPREGAGDDPLSDPEIEDLIAKGNTAQAIKHYADRTGLGLDEAKAAIERAVAEAE